MSNGRQLHDVVCIGENEQYRFYIGRCGERWLGFAGAGRFSGEVRTAFQSEGLSVDPAGIFIFSEVSESWELGLLDRAQAILLTGAIAPTATMAATRCICAATRSARGPAWR